jgi:hypothetical protein
MHAAVFLIAFAPDQPRRLQSLNDARHRRRPHLLGGRELAEGARAAEDKDGQGGELGRRDAGGRILAAYVPEGVDGRRVEAICSID